MKDYNIYIHSKNRDPTQKSYDFTIYFKNQITCNKDQYLQVNVMSFYMMNTMYNISNSLNNYHFEIEKINIQTNESQIVSYNIPYGNYSVYSLRDTLNSLLSGDISLSYNNYTNTYTFTKLNNNFRYYIKNIQCNKALNIHENTEIVSGIQTDFINLIEYQQILIKTDLIYDDLNQDNLFYRADDLLNISSILFWTHRQNIQPFSTITYENNDAGDSFSYNLVNTNLNAINFKVYNEEDELISDCPDWFIHLRFRVIDRPKSYDFSNAFERIFKLLNDIKFVLTNIFLNKKI